MAEFAGADPLDRDGVVCDPFGRQFPRRALTLDTASFPLIGTSHAASDISEF